MPRIVRGALLQATWTGDKESMIQKHEGYAHEAAKQGAQFMLFQELFYGPYFCQVQDTQYYRYTELIPDGPTTKRMQDLAKQTGHGPRRPDVRGGRARHGHLLQHRGRHRRRRDVPRQVPQDAHPARQGLLGEVLLPARATSAIRSSRPPSARSASTSATTATSPRVPARSASTAPRSCSSRRPPAAACPSTSGGSSRSATRSPTATSSGRSTGSASRPRSATTTSTARATSATRAASSSAASAARTTRSCSSATSTSTWSQKVRKTWQFYRDRRPDAYGDLTRP